MISEELESENYTLASGNLSAIFGNYAVTSEDFSFAPEYYSSTPSGKCGSALRSLGKTPAAVKNDDTSITAEYSCLDVDLEASDSVSERSVSVSEASASSSAMESNSEEKNSASEAAEKYADSPCSSDDSDTNVKPRKGFISVKEMDWFKCAVCGDRATGHHYNVLSCNGCKTFYRRTVIAGRKFLCKKNGKCAFDRDHRCTCRACRFQKCVQAGMNPQIIQVQRDLKRRNVRDRSGTPESSGAENGIVSKYDDIHKTSPTTSLQTLLIASQESNLSLLQNLMHIDNCCQYLRVSNYPIDANDELEDILLRPCALGELAKFQLLSVFSDRLPNWPPASKWFAMDLRLTIEYAKTFDAFRKLSYTDQRLLLKQTGSVVMILMEAFASFESQSHTVIFPDGTVPGTDVYLPLTDAVKQYFISLVTPFRKHQLKKEYYVMLKAIVFCTITSSDLSEEGRKLMEAERSKICLALHNFLLQELGPTKGPALFGVLLHMVHLYVALTEKRRNQLLLYELFGYRRFNTLTCQMVTRKK